MDCRNFEIQLWEYPDRYSETDKLPKELSDHIDSCDKCRQLYREYLNLTAFANKGEIVKTEGYWQKFEDNVWDKIDHLENASQTESDKIPDLPLAGSHTSIAFKHLVASVSVAAAAVVFMFMAVSDITKRTDIPVPPAAKNAAHAIKGHSPLLRSQSIQPSINVLLNRSIDGKMDLDDFSILPESEINVVSDSSPVAIESAFLTDEGLEDKIEATNALSANTIMEIKKVDYSSNAEFRASREEATPEEWIISVEKMPKMTKAVPPEYPMGAFGMNTGGEVWVKAYVNANGKVEYATIYRESGTNFGFENAALDAAKKNEFEPFEIDGVKHPIWVIYKVRFVAK